nr:RNA-directed DNA polymerase, eukaryota [Tanacetum cinerariifolium]
MDKQELNCDNLNGGASNQGEHVNAGIDNSYSKREGTESVGSGRFKKGDALRTGGSILTVMDELIKVGQTMGFKMDGCMKNIEEIIESQGVNEFSRGKWVSNGKLLLIVSVYAPQELTERKMLWEYLMHVMASWKGDVIIMGDFNEVRYSNERFGSNFNVKGANALTRSSFRRV